VATTFAAVAAAVSHTPNNVEPIGYILPLLILSLPIYPVAINYHSL